VTIGRSILTVATAARSRQLTTLATVKERLGVSGSSKDAALTRLINEASRKLAGAAFLGREPWRESLTEQLPGYGPQQQNLYLSRFPIETVTSVTKDGLALDATSYSIAGRHRSCLYRKTGWDWTARYGSRLVDDPTLGTEELAFLATYTAGWLMPGQVKDWAPATVFAKYSWCRATDPTNQLRFEATAVSGTGTTGGGEPTWPTVVGDTATDIAGGNQIVWTARSARELPEDLELAAWRLVQRGYYGDSGNPLAQSISKGGASITYATTSQRREELEDEIRAICAEYR